MGKGDWIEIYESYSGEELEAEIAQLKKSIKGAYSAQGAGSVNHQKDLQMLENQLGAAVRVQNQRKNRQGRVGQVDFGNIRMGDL